MNNDYLTHIFNYDKMFLNVNYVFSLVTGLGAAALKVPLVFVLTLAALFFLMLYIMVCQIFLEIVQDGRKTKVLWLPHCLVSVVFLCQFSVIISLALSLG